MTRCPRGHLTQHLGATCILCEVQARRALLGRPWQPLRPGELAPIASRRQLKLSITRA